MTKLKAEFAGAEAALVLGEIFAFFAAGFAAAVVAEDLEGAGGIVGELENGFGI